MTHLQETQIGYWRPGTFPRPIDLSSS